MHRVKDASTLAVTLNAIRENGRTPLVVSAFENPTPTQAIRENMGLLYPNLEKHLFLRTLGLEMENVGYSDF